MSSSGKQSILRQRRDVPVTASKTKSADGRSQRSFVSRSILNLGSFDLLIPLSLVFGGCCSNVWSFEELLRSSSQLGTLITFGQMLFITCHSLPSFIQWHKAGLLTLPTLIPRQVPLGEWALQVAVLMSGALLNNWAFAYNVPLTLQIVFRSSGLPVSMLLGHLVLKKRYRLSQLLSVFLVSVGVILATTSRPSAKVSYKDDDRSVYLTGILMLSISLFLTGILGILQEQTYKKYGPCWREGVFYTHLLSLPMFLFLIGDIRKGLDILGASAPHVMGLRWTYVVFVANLFTQLICVSGVNQMTSRVSSVTTNLVLTTRKAFSLCLSVWIFRGEWNSGLIIGAIFVFFGSFLYTLSTAYLSTTKSEK